MGRKRKKSVLFFVTENEFLMMKQNAEKTKLSLSEYIRKCCITNSKLIIQDTEYILDLIKEVNNISIDINKLMTIACDTNAISKSDLKLILESLNELRRSMLQIKNPI